MSLTWIHPEYNAQFCQFYDSIPGDLPNFFVIEDTTDLGEELMELNSIDALADWLHQMQAA